MSSASSVCSSNDIDYGLDSRIPPAIKRDVERFSMFISRLRAALDVDTNVPDGESMCVSVHAALEMVSESMRDLFKHPQFKTNHVILPSLQLVQSVKDLKFDSAMVETTRVHNVIDQLESAVLNTIINSHVNQPSPARHFTLGRRPKPSSTEVYTTCQRVATLQRRHSTYQDIDGNDEHSQLMDLDRILNTRIDGLEIAFERTKAWSNYSKDLLSYIRARLQLEQDHARKVTTLVEQCRRDISKPFMPLRDVFESSFDSDIDLVGRTKETTDHLKARVVEALDARRKEHDIQRGALKLEWTKLTKSLHDCEDMVEKCRVTLKLREEAVRKARENSLRSESITISPSMSTDPMKRRREMEKKKRIEEEAIIKKAEAEKQLAISSAELRRKRKELETAKERIVEKLRELVFQCDQTTKACASHYFKALATLWVKLPGSYQDLADATRDYPPGGAYMAYLHSLPQRATSSHSFLREGRSVDDGLPPFETGSMTSLRRNAINPDDECQLPDTKRHKKTSVAGRLYETSELSETALSHRVQRTVQPSKCSHCDTLSILYTVQCTDCGAQWHKTCFPKTTQTCGQSDRPCERRMSIFGVSLQGHLEMQQRTVPLIIESTIHELQKRGMRVKGIYRTCGVKSKIEEICEAFERCAGDSTVDLEHVHPMNLASVVKLYLRKLPEPLMTYELYNEWIRFGVKCNEEPDDEHLEELKRLTRRLPLCNYETLKHLMLHLNRVTWFQESNLMGPSNLSTVVAPSLVWQPSTSADHTSAIIDAQHANRTVQCLITHAFTVFGVDRTKDWEEFFSKYALEEPPKEEDAGNVSDDEDIVDDDVIDLEDDEQLFVPQPPTPDLLKSTRRERADERALSCHGSPEDHKRRFEKGDRREKRRSYTTSILISPNAERQTTVTRQKSLGEKTALSRCAADVTVDVSKGQIFVDRNRDGKLIQRRQSHKEYTSQDLDSPSNYDKECAKDSAHIISLHNVGDLFPGTEQDVSYV
uniref:Rho-GAP domain-containing protein n=1 Tax=Haemonchus contortus TaxID=6289 RepID=A0A7I4Y7U4_HAECO|nr:Protein kinase C and RhoGAP domain containing protein [Haemonchus contortus]